MTAVELVRVSAVDDGHVTQLVIIATIHHISHLKINWILV